MHDLLQTVGSILYTYKNRSELACMDGMIIAMALGAMSSISLGMNIQVYGMAVGFITGKLVSLTASIEGVMSGVMGVYVLRFSHRASD
ncbi:hypothetical protein [Brevibacillus invocatus]|uniref:hypothetical protein n=1 Tax=Brevibacillus invocatus TaxID=173959 RepID=UPI001FE452A4|nr:hypothetical protein [Brevibacillus invocatus]